MWLKRFMKRVKLFVKLALSFGLVAFVLYQIDTKKLFEIIKEIDIFYFFLAFLAYNISKIISALRLNYYFKEIGIELDFFTGLKLYYMGMFYNLFLPGGIGGDGYKIYILKKRKKSTYKELVTVTLLDRVSGLVALLFLGALFFIFSSFAKVTALKIAAIAVLILSYPAFFAIYLKFFKKYAKYLKETVFLGFLVQLFQLLSAYFLLLSLPQNPPVIDFLALFFISSIIAVLPITFGGVGAREATFLYGLRFLGYDPSLGVAFSFLFFFINLLSGLIGIIFINISKEISQARHPARQNIEEAV